MNGNQPIAIDAPRLWNSLDEMAAIGPGIAGGNNRQALTDEDAGARETFRRWCNAAGCTMSVDAMGNQFARREGRDPDAPPVCLGSHLDTQPTGGRYDGVLGVLGGLEVVRTLNDLGLTTRHPIVVINWTNEEGTRFAPSMMGSGVFAGVYERDWAYAREDSKGLRFGDELDRIGWKGDAESTSLRTMKAYFELHIEQGPILESERKTIGVVTHGQGLSWTAVRLRGRDAHTGSTPMAMRRDAGRGMAMLVGAVNAIALAHSPHALGSVGRIDVQPNSPNVVPGSVELTVDFRSPDLRVLRAMESSLRERGDAIAAKLGLEISYEKIGGFDPVSFDARCVEAVRAATVALGYAHRDIVAGAGHDACWVNRVSPAAMVMCPCVDGLSHNEAEAITSTWAEAGANVLANAVISTAGRDG